MNEVVVRIERSYLNHVTVGRILLNGVIVCDTLELPWRMNQANISCIPEGTYHTVRHSSTKFTGSYKLLNVLDRTGILIHAGNTLSDTTGCILVGTASLNSYVINRSRIVLNKLNVMLPDSFYVVIKTRTI